MVSRRGHRSQLLDAGTVRARFPAWNADAFPHGTYGAEGGFAESGKVIARLVEEARRLGVELRQGIAFERLLDDGIVASGGKRLEADCVVVAAGTWTAHLLPWLAAEW